MTTEMLLVILGKQVNIIMRSLRKLKKDSLRGSEERHSKWWILRSVPLKLIK